MRIIHLKQQEVPRGFMGKKFRAEIGGSSIGRPIEAEFNKLSEARRWAEEFGTTADRCNVYRGERLVASYRRDPNGNGTKWFKAAM